MYFKNQCTLMCAKCAMRNSLHHFAIRSGCVVPCFAFISPAAAAAHKQFQKHYLFNFNIITMITLSEVSDGFCVCSIYLLLFRLSLAVFFGFSSERLKERVLINFQNVVMVKRKTP